MLKKKKTPTFITNSIEISSDDSDRDLMILILIKTIMKKMKHGIFFIKISENF